MINIYTFGEFDILVNHKSIVHFMGNSVRLIRLFKYFLTFEGKKMLPNKIIEDLWDGIDYEEPLSVLQTQISRLRHVFSFEKCNIQPFFAINYIDGYYLFQLNDKCTVDYKEMELYINKQNLSYDKKQTLELGYKIINLYKDEYLTELGNAQWLIPVRSRYNRLFVKSLYIHLHLLSEMLMDNEIISLCEELMYLLPYEEIIHLYYIKSLLVFGQIRNALNDYVYYTSKMYNELRISPSDKMLSLYKIIRSNEDDVSSNVTLNSLRSELMDLEDNMGPLICDTNYFKFLYNFKNRTKTTALENIFIGIITIDNSGIKEILAEEMKNYNLVLLEVIKYGLKNSDVITQCNKNQFIVLISDLGEEDVIFLINRLKETFNNIVNDKKVELNIKFQEL